MTKLKIDKTNWKPVKFGDVVYEPKETVKDLVAENIEHVVGLEHINSDDIHLRKSASIIESTTFTKKFAKGDVLFGRRRAYLRKAAQAQFEGICSGDITVFRAKPALSVRLLPFVVNNDAFFDYAIKHSAGGLSPRVKFRDLADYEFLLPPLEEQEKLADLLWAMDEVIEREKTVLQKIEVLLSSYIKQIFTSHIDSTNFYEINAKSVFQTRIEKRKFPIGWKNYTLSNVIENSQNGFAEGKRDDNGIPQLRMNNVTREGRIDLSEIALIPESIKSDKYKICRDDVMFCNTNSEDLVGKSIIADDSIVGFYFSNHFTRLRPKEKYLTPRFLYLWLKFHFDIGLFSSICTKWIGQAAVQTESLMKLHIVVPPISEQIIAEIKSKAYEDRIDLIKIKIASSKALQKSLINQIF